MINERVNMKPRAILNPESLLSQLPQELMEAEIPSALSSASKVTNGSPTLPEAMGKIPKYNV